MIRFSTERVTPAVIAAAFVILSYFLFDVVRFVQPLTKFLDYSLTYIPMVFLFVILLTEKHTMLNLPRAFIAIFFCFSLVFTTAATNFIRVRSWLFVMPLSVVIWFVILPESPVNKKNIIFLLRVILYVAFLYCVANLVIHYDKLFSFWAAIDPYKNNIQGVYFNKNMWGQLMLPLLFVNLVYIKLRPERKLKAYALFGILIYTLFASLSRAAILTFLLFFIFYLLLLVEKKHLKYLCLILGILAAGVACLLWLPSLQHFWTDYFFRSHNILTFRDKLWMMAFSYAADMPFWGYGIGSELRLINAYGINLGAFHNTYIDWYMQGGLAFIVSNFLIWGMSFYQICKLYKKERPVGAVFLAAFVAMAIYCNVEYITLYTFSMPNLLFCFFFLALPRLIFQRT